MMRAYAKLNLALSVGASYDAPASRAHGMHPICSYMHAIELSDEVTLMPLDAGDTSDFEVGWVSGDGSIRGVGWAIERDLVYRAHGALEHAIGHPLACSIRVRKSIPAGGGLGGGSADAGAVLVGLDHAFGLGLGGERLREIAMTLGSDIGFFIDDRLPPRPAIVSSYGDQIERVATAHTGTAVTLILPGFGCSTGSVYQAFDQLGAGVVDARRVRTLLDADVLVDALLHNDLCPAACAVAPELGGLIDRLADLLGRSVHVTGSGSTLFVLGRIAPETICEVVPDCGVVCTRLV